jgi:hypothetical protein
MVAKRGKIADIIVGPRWRVEHRATVRPNPSVVFDIVGGADEAEAVEKVRAAYTRHREIVSAERLD